MGFGLVAEDEVGAGIASAERGELSQSAARAWVRRGAVSGSSRICSWPWPGMMLLETVSALRIRRRPRCQRAQKPFSARARAVSVLKAAIRMAWVICLTSASSRIVRGDLAEADAGGDGCRASWLPPARGEPWTGASRASILWSVMVTAGRAPGRGALPGWRRAGPGRGGEDLGVADPGGGGSPGWVGDFPAWVVGRGGVGVQGVQGEVGAGAAEVVLLPPPRGQPPADFPAARPVREVSAYLPGAPPRAGTRG